jgi:hypothetical protein
LVATAQFDDQQLATLHVTPLRARPEALAHHEHAFADDRGTSSPRRVLLLQKTAFLAAARRLRVSDGPARVRQGSFFAA